MGGKVTGGTTEVTLRTSHRELTQDLGKHCKTSPCDVLLLLNPGDVIRSAKGEETNKHETTQHSINPEAYVPIWNVTEMGGKVTGGTTEVTLWTSHRESTQDLGKHCKASPCDVLLLLNPGDVIRNVNSEEKEEAVTNEATSFRTLTMNGMLDEATARGHGTSGLSA